MAAETVLIDEHEGRLAASRLGLNITGVVGILIQAKKLGRIPVIAPEFEKLRRQANFFLSQKLILDALAACGEA